MGVVRIECGGARVSGQRSAMARNVRGRKKGNTHVPSVQATEIITERRRSVDDNSDAIKIER